MIAYLSRSGLYGSTDLVQAFPSVPISVALATGNSRARRSPFELLLRTLTGLDPIPKTNLGPLPKQFSLRFGSGPLALWVPRQIRATKGNSIMYKNHIDLIGFIGSDPEARQTSNGTAVTTLSLATKSSWKNELELEVDPNRWTKFGPA